MLNVKFGTLPEMVSNIDSFFDGEIEKHLMLGIIIFSKHIAMLEVVKIN